MLGSRDMVLWGGEILGQVITRSSPLGKTTVPVSSPALQISPASLVGSQHLGEPAEYYLQRCTLTSLGSSLCGTTSYSTQSNPANRFAERGNAEHRGGALQGKV